MIFLMLLVLLLILVPWRRQAADGSMLYMSRHHTNLINGFFIFVVFLRHFCSREPQMNSLDMWYVEWEGRLLCQLLVSTFFFFSGFGIQCSLLKKGREYACSLITKRFRGLLMSFGLMVLLYLGIQLLHGERYSLGHVVLSLLAWKSVGNPSWFIFMTLSEYLIVAFCWLLFSRWGSHTVVLVTIMVTAVWLFVIGTCKPFWYVNTLLCVPFGMLFALHKDGMLQIQQRMGSFVLFVVPVLLLVGGYVHINGYNMTSLPVLNYWVGSLIANLGAGLFALGWALVAGWLSLVMPLLSRPARFLAFCGGPALFYIYMLHGIPLQQGKRMGLVAYGECYLVLSLLTTVLLVWGAFQVNKKLCKK